MNDKNLITNEGTETNTNPIIQEIPSPNGHN